MALSIEKIFDWTLWNPLDPVSHTSRVPMKIWTDLSLKRDQKNSVLQLGVNPENVKFDQTKRITSSQVKDGRVYFFWSSGPGEQNLDVLELTIRGKSGSILNRVASKGYSQGIGEDRILNPPKGAINTKHKKWMKLYAMTREAAYPVELSGEFNFAHIEYVSPLFPEGKDIEFTGHFADPLRFDEDAARPFLIDYTFKFVVHKTTPDLDVLLEKAETILVDKG
jgi:hypothetical protein